MEYNKDTTTEIKVILGKEFVGMDVGRAKIFGSNVIADGLSENMMNQTIATHVPGEEAKTSFWTTCPTCNMNHEYAIKYLNNILLCRNCQNPFVAFEILSPLLNKDSLLTYQTFNQPKWEGTNAVASSRAPPSTPRTGQTNSVGDKVSPKFGNANIFHGAASSTVKVTQAFQSIFEHLKRGYKEPSLATSRDQIAHGVPLRKVVPADLSCGTSSSSLDHGNKRASSDKYPIESLTKKIRKPVGRMRSAQTKVQNGVRNLTRSQNRSMLVYKARREIGQKLKEWNVGKPKEVSIAPKSDKTPCVTPNVESQTVDFVPVLMAVPDSDFHDFDKYRVEEVFGDNQVWAIYDDDDGMPRFYAIINKVVSLKPFKIEICWLISKGNKEFGSMDWVGQGFPKTSGVLRKGKHEIYGSLSAFSHKVKWRKGTRGLVQIYPQKGDVWALYRNWSPNWNAFTPDDVKHSYDVVEVLEDYYEEHGVTVAPLVKVRGFKTVFQKHSDVSKTRTVPKEEMLRFSHQVPAFVLRGEEGPNAPRGCWELDPAALPMELLEVLTQAQDGEVQNTGHQFKDQSSTCYRNDNTVIRGSKKEKRLLVYQRGGKKRKQDDPR